MSEPVPANGSSRADLSREGAEEVLSRDREDYGRAIWHADAVTLAHELLSALGENERLLDERDAAVAALRQILAYDMTQPGPPIMAMWEIAREALAAVGEAEEPK